MTNVISQDATHTTSPSYERSEGNCYVALMDCHLDVLNVMAHVRSPKAGALVLFAGTYPLFFPSYLVKCQIIGQDESSFAGAGTTRDNFGGKPVKELEYTSYKPKALLTMLQICKAVSARYSLTAIAMAHRLGTVPVGEESILIAVSCPHRGPAWRAGEEALEECKAKVEVWKREEFGGEEGGVWRANRDGGVGVRISNLAEPESDQVLSNALTDNMDMVMTELSAEKRHEP